jgi:hypothetical protein
MPAASSIVPEPTRPVPPPAAARSEPQLPAADGLRPFPILEEVARPPYKLHPLRHIAVATFLLGPGAGLLLLGVNFARLGRKAAVVGTIVFALLTLLVLFTVALFTNSVVPNFILSLPLFLLLLGAGKLLQGSAYEAHLDRGGLAASGGESTGVALLGFALFFALAFGGGFLLDLVEPRGLGEKVAFVGGEEVYYSGGVTQGEASAVGVRLQLAGFFNGHDAKTVVLKREKGRVVVSFVILPFAFQDPEILQFFSDFRQELSQQVFGGQAVEIRLCDEYLRVKKTLP